MRPFNNLENTIPSDTYWKVQLVFIKVHAHTSLDSPLEYNQDQTPWRVKVDYGTLQQFVRYWNTWGIKSRLLWKYLKKQLLFIRGRRQYLRAIKWRRYSRSTVKNTISNLPKVAQGKFLGNTFVSLTWASLTASRTFSQRWLAGLNPILDVEDLFCWYKWKKVVPVIYGSSTSRWKTWK